MPHPAAPSSRNRTKTRNHGCVFTPALLILCTKWPKAYKPVREFNQNVLDQTLGSSYPKFKREENRKVNKMPNFMQAILT